MMMELPDLPLLDKQLSGRKVLSVYVNGAVSNPAERNNWRKLLDAGISEIRSRITREGGNGEIQDLDTALEHLRASLPPAADMLTTRGWAGFFTADGSAAVYRLPAHAPNLVRWEPDGVLSPLVHAFKQLTPVYVALADSRGAELFRYREGELEKLESLEVETVIGPVYHMGDAPRGGFHPGVRGTTGTDEAERVTRAASERMFRSLAEKLQKLANSDGWILLGGTSEVCASVTALLPDRLRGRAAVNASLHMRSRAPELLAAAKSAASELRIRTDRAMVEGIADLAGAGGKGAVGINATLRALKSNAVQSLFFTTALLESDPALLEEIVRQALRQGAEIEHATGDAAAKLDELGGVAARLRFIQEGAQAVS